MDLLGLLITLVILGLIFGVLWWGIQQIPLPAPFPMVIRVIFVLVVVVVLVSMLTGNLPLIRLGRA
jgi:hypothetical protein